MVIVGGLIDALHCAGWADAPKVLAALSDAELAGGIEQASLPIGVAVSDFVLGQAAGAEQTGSAVLALTRRALADQTVADPDTVLRALIRLADPAVDELLFRDDSAPRPRNWMLRAVVRDRRGADGRPVIAPGVDRFLRRQVHRTERRLSGYDRPHPARIEQVLLEAALFADDPDLAAFALPLGIRLRHLPGVAQAMVTLRDHGRLAELWHDGLRESLAEVARDHSHYRHDQWEALAKLGDQGAYDHIVSLLRRSRSSAVLPSPEDADQWTAPNTASQHSELDWSSVIRFARVVGEGEEGTQAGQATSRGLDEAAAREDMPEGTRITFEELYPRALYWTARPTVATVVCAALDNRVPNPAARHFGLRELLRRGLLHGSLSAADAVAYGGPAGAVLGLAVPVPPSLTEYYTAKGKNSFAPHNSRIPAEAEERFQADLRAAVAEAVGPDPRRWLKVLTRVGSWDDSLAALVRAVDDGEGLPTRRAHRWPRGIDPAAVLLDIAPEEVLDAVLAAASGAVEAEGATADGREAVSGEAVSASSAGGSEAVGATAVSGGAVDGETVSGEQVSASSAGGGEAVVPASAAATPVDPEAKALAGVLTRILDRGPVPRRLVDHALGPHGTPAMRLAVARNPAATGNTLWRLADREPPEPQVLAALYLHPLATRELRVAVIVRSEEAGGVYPGLVRRLVSQDADPALLIPALESRAPELLHSVLRRGGRVIETDRRIAAYARLAEAAGPEPVWALELERAGSLERMHQAVRASMAAHSDAPLRAAVADADTQRPARVSGAWDAALHPSRPDTADRVRACLDGRPERWLRLLEPGMTLYKLLAELEAED